MSKTIDERVVEMRFDNDNFEKNVKTSMNTLGKFKQSLNFTGAAKGLDEINEATRKVNFSPISDGLETVKVSFSALQIAAYTVLQNITNSALAAGKNIASALTIDPIRTGFNEYEQKMDSVRVIMASTGEDLDTVNKKIQELNKYADDTIYSFSDMTMNIGKFTNAGVKLDDAVMAIKGISNEAARSGANANEASRAMYNFAQALSMGYVQLIDWKSIENANMATVEFKNTLLETALATGKVTKTANGMYKTGKDTYNLQQMFKDGLKDQWLTSDILIDTLKKYADESTDFGKKMYDAATQVSTVSKLWDTLREAAQSGWGNTWELLIGDLDEAKKLLTSVSNIISDILNASSKARNDILREWKDLGGRNDLIEAFSNIYKSISSLLKPIREAFREIFPRMTGKQLADITKRFKEFTQGLIISAESSENLKNTFKGIFKVLKVFVDLAKNVASAVLKIASNFKGIGGYILSFTGSLGNAIGEFADFITSTGILTKGLTAVVDLLEKIITKVQEFASKAFSISKVTDIFSKLFEFIKNIGKAIGDALSSVISSGGLKDGIAVVNGGIFGGILLGLKKFIKNINKFVSNSKGFMANIQDLLVGVKDILKSYQKEIQAKTLMEIAKAIGIMAVSLLILATIDDVKLLKALGGMSLMIMELMGALFAFIKILSFDNMKNITKGSAALISISVALLILSGALKILSSIELEKLVESLTAIGISLVFLVDAVIMLPDKDVRKAASALKSLAKALVIYALAMKILSTIELKDMIISLTSVGIALVFMVNTINLLKPEKAISKALSMVILADALILMGASLKILASIGLEDMIKSLASMGIALVFMVNTINLLKPEKAISKAFSMVILATSLIVLAKALKDLGSMDLSTLGKGLGAIAIALFELVLAMNLIKSDIKTAASIMVVSTSLIILAKAVKMFGSMDIPTLAKGLGAMAVALLELWAAGVLLGPLAPALLAVAGAMALFGISALAFGTGLTLIATGITALAGALSVGVNIIIAGISSIILGLIKLIPEIIRALADIIKAICETIIESAPLIAHSILSVTYEIIKELDEYAPQIIDTLLDLFIKLIDTLTKRMPELMTSIMNLAGTFIQSFIDALNNLDQNTVSNMIEGVKGLSLVLVYLAALSYLAPAAAKGIIAFGLLVAELAAVLSILGGLSTIPGLYKAIEYGGNLLESIGEAIGKFVAGLAKGATSTLPDIGKNISDFMIALEPFLEGVKDVDNNIFDKVKILCDSIKKLAGANFISGLSKITGSDLKTVGKDLSDFIKNMKPFFEAMEKIDSKLLEGVDMLSTALIKITESNLLNSVTQLLPGNNSLKKFGEQLKYLGEGVNGFVKEITKNVSSDSIGYVETVCKIVKLLSEIFDNLPDIKGKDLENKGWGLGSAIGHLANGISYFSAKIKDIDFDENRITSISKFTKDISEVFSNLPDIKGADLENKGWGFGSTIGHLANGISYFSAKINECNLNEGKITSAANSIKTLSEVIPNVSEVKGRDLENVGWGFGSTIGHLANGISYFSAKINECNLNESLVTAACNSIKTISEAIPNLPNIDGSTLENKGWGFGSLIGHLANGISYFSAKINECNLNEANIVAACNSIKTISETIPNISEVKGKDLENKGWGFGSLIGHLANGISYFSAKINECGLNENLVTAACNSIKSLSEIFSNLPDIKGPDLENIGWGFGSAIGHLGNGLSAFINGIGQADITNIDSYIGYIKQLADITSGLTNDMNTNLNNFANGLKTFSEAFSTFFNKLTEIGLDTIKEGIAKVKDLITLATSIASVSVESLNTFSTSLVQVATEGVDGFCKAFSDFEPKDKVKQSTIAMIGAAILGAEETLPKLVDKFKTACSDILTYIATQYEAMRGVGLYFTQGFEQGIKEGTGPVVEAARAMAANAVIAAKQAIDSNSPSKETMKLGNYFGSGFAIGIKEYFGKVYDTAYDSGNLAKEGLSNAISKISSIVEDGIDTNPTIRPVLDLSDVEAGASYLGSMFGTNSIGVNNNLNSISNGFNSRIQNGGSDILSAIKNLETTILTKCGNTTNIYTQELDSAKLDQIVAHVNREFGIMY